MNLSIQKIYITILKDGEDIQRFTDNEDNTYSLMITYQNNPHVIRPYLLTPDGVSSDPQQLYSP